MYVTAVIVVVIFVLTWRWYRRLPPRLNLPCPPGLPIIGNLRELDPTAPHHRLTELARTYGPVYCLRIFNKNIVVVNSYKTIKEVLLTKGTDFAGRPKGRFRFNYLYFGKTDLVFSNPDVPYWRTARTAVTHNLKMYDKGLERLEGVLTTATLDIMDKVRDQNGEPFDINQDLHNFTMKMILYFTSGLSPGDSDPLLLKLKEMQHLILITSALTAGQAMLDAFPFLRHLGNESFKKLARARDLLDELWNTLKAEQDADPDNPVYVASCMHDLRNLEGSLKDNDGNPLMEDTHSRNIIQNLWMAGIITTSNNLYALIIILCQKPLIAKRIQDEVETVVGASRHVSLKDKDDLHYTRAAILETLRYCSIVSLGLPHATTTQTQLLGEDIPKGTTVLTNLWALNHDSEVWDEPWEYRPERFLDDEGHLRPPDDEVRKHLVAFGGGPRVCMGAVLAMNRMIIFTASLMQKFNLHPDPDNMTSYDPRSYNLAAVLFPKPYKVRFISRDDI